MRLSTVMTKSSFETAAPLASARCTIWRGILQTELKKGKTITISEAGDGLGYLGGRFTKASGLMVIAREEGLTLVRDGGADIITDTRQEKKKAVAEVGNQVPERNRCGSIVIIPLLNVRSL